MAAPRLRLGDVKPGDRLVADGGFGCIRAGAVLTVVMADDGELAVPCDAGLHKLAGQVGPADQETLVGLVRADPPR